MLVNSDVTRGSAVMEEVCLFVLIALCSGAAAQTYVLDDTGGLGRVFDGIGGLSGGGVSLPGQLAVLTVAELHTNLGYFSSFGKLPREAKSRDPGLSIQGSA